MTAVSEDASVDLKRRIAELERRLDTALIERDAAIDRQTASALVNFRLQNEARAALERQNAGREILRTIAETAGDAEHALQKIAETTQHFFNAASVTIRVAEGDEWIQTVRVGSSGHLTGSQATSDLATRGSNLPGTIYGENRQIHIPDLDHIDPSMADWPVTAARAAGIRTVCGSPLRREGKAIGALIVYRDRLAPFSDDELALQQDFANQAVIAIENARLFNETREALERQTATADILKVIASSPADVQPVFEAIVASANRLMSGYSTAVYRFTDGIAHLKAFTPSNAAADEMLRTSFPRPVDSLPQHELIARGEVIHFADAQRPEHPDMVRRISEARGFRSMMGVPLIKHGETIGLISVTHREAGGFADKHVQLLQTFADQAVIAIENARLFNEVQAALERQTATAEILRVIASSPSDVQPVFDAIAASAKRLLDGFSTAVFRLVDDTVHVAAFTPTNPTADAKLMEDFPMPVEAFEPFRMVQPHEPLPIADTEALPPSPMRDIARLNGFRSMLYVPLMNGGVPTGLIAVTRAEPGAFATHHVQLLQTFADQAVIAIENARLFEEVQARTSELEESLQQQTTTAEVLGVIASSPTDVNPVLKAIAESASRMCEANDAYIALKDGDDLVFQAQLGSIPVGWDRRPINREWPSGRAVVDGRPVHLHDLHGPEGEEFPGGRDLARNDGVRTILVVPLMLEGECIGVIILRRTAVLPFSDKQITLLKTFADQAVIAIGNARLFDEVQARTRELTEALTYQTGSANILRVIASSPTDVGPVLQSIVESACELCEAYDAAVVLRDGDDLRFSAHHGPIPIGLETWPINRRWTAGRAFIDQVPVHIADLRDDSHEDFSDGRELAIRMGHRSILSVPLLRDHESIGAIVLRRTEVNPFTNKQIALLQTFADQAVIAIGNVHLFEEVQARTRELAKSLDDLRAAQDRLVQTEKLASLGQLTAGIAHEIKNPLNFVNNFAALSAELTDELKDALRPAVLDETIRLEVNEITGLLKDNLGKVVQHGKRADSIVRNMLLHSREGSGEHRPTDVNALVDESLNLAYHGARAEKPQFNVTLQRDFDPEAGTIEAFPQEITRVLLNLITNGFYAVSKRKENQGDTLFEPVVSATTRGGTNHVEIRIRDNGTGIPPEVKEKMFNPFFTTKPAGEGTGLGLSMSHDIIVKQHGGTIDVDTVSGEFTEFTVVLPRHKT